MKELAIGLIVTALAGCTGSASTPPAVEAAASPPPTLVAAEVEPTLQAEWLTVAKDEGEPEARRVAYARTIIRSYPDSPEAVEAKVVLDGLGVPVELPKWHYVMHTDQLSGKKGTTASLTSENTLEFGFPYEGAQHGMLMVRRDKRLGNEVIVAIERGQILCQSYSTCSVRIAFDDGNPRTLRGNDAADGSNTMVFLPGYSSLIRQIAKAKEMRVQFEVFQQGSPVLVFDVTGFDPDKLK